MTMKIDIIPLGTYQENTYIVHDNQHVLIVDPGVSYKLISDYIKDDEIVDGIVLTHGHFDHTYGVDDLMDHFDCKCYIHKNDYQLIDPKGVRQIAAHPVYHTVERFDQSDLTVGTFQLKVYFTPGHTAGGCCIRYRNRLFTGDTLFAGDVGRTDLFSGDEDTLMNSVKVFHTIEKDVIVYPGHGPSTTIGQELQTNPYIQ